MTRAASTGPGQNERLMSRHPEKGLENFDGNKYKPGEGGDEDIGGMAFSTRRLTETEVRSAERRGSTPRSAPEDRGERERDRLQASVAGERAERMTERRRRH